jgi:hypothetical protein
MISPSMKQPAPRPARTASPGTSPPNDGSRSAPPAPAAHSGTSAPPHHGDASWSSTSTTHCSATPPTRHGPGLPEQLPHAPAHGRAVHRLAHPRQPTRSPPRHHTEQRLAAPAGRRTKPATNARPRDSAEVAGSAPSVKEGPSRRVLAVPIGTGHGGRLYDDFCYHAEPWIWHLTPFADITRISKMFCDFLIDPVS